MKVENKIKVYEIDEEDAPIASDYQMTIRSHWNDSDMVLLEFPPEAEGKIVTGGRQRSQDGYRERHNHKRY